MNRENFINGLQLDHQASSREASTIWPEILFNSSIEDAFVSICSLCPLWLTVVLVESLHIADLDR